MREEQEDLPALEDLPTSGNYTVIIFLESSSRIMAPRCRWSRLNKGYYAYTGSAVGKGAVSLRKRVARHLRKNKNKHWHIDHLLACRKAKVTAVVACAGTINRECKINNLIQSIRGATVPMEKFGASDCQQNCKSHLVYFAEDDIYDAIVDTYRGLSRDVRAIRVT